MFSHAVGIWPTSTMVCIEAIFSDVSFPVYTENTAHLLEATDSSGKAFTANGLYDAAFSARTAAAQLEEYVATELNTLNQALLDLEVCVEKAGYCLLRESPLDV